MNWILSVLSIIAVVHNVWAEWTCFHVGYATQIKRIFGTKKCLHNCGYLFCKKTINLLKIGILRAYFGQSVFLHSMEKSRLKSTFLSYCVKYIAHDFKSPFLDIEIIEITIYMDSQ